MLTQYDKEKNLIIYDNYYPNIISGFRIAEFNHYLKVYQNCKVYSSNPEFENVLVDYNKYYPEYSKQIFPFDANKEYNASLGYSVFLNNTVNFLPTYERNKLPFVFTLYPGGGLWLDEANSDDKLVAICSSKFLKKIFVTQKITKEYLLRKGFCSVDLIEYIYGGIVPTDYFLENRKNKKYYKNNKSTFDICFVAYKYMEKGIDKGYDIFIKVCRLLSKYSSDFRFHVVGNFNEKDISISGLRGSIKFYGLQFRDFFPEFYSGMDIILSPNIPFVLYPGSFDGFPTSTCVEAGISGVSVLCTDELGLNEHFINNEDICIIPRNEYEICNIILKYIDNLVEFYEFAEKSQKKFLEIFDFRNQIDRRLNVLNYYL